MNDITDASWFLPVVVAAVLLLGLLAWRWFAGRKSPLQKAISDISFDQLHDLVIPSADEGEIHIDELLLTSQGLLILEVKDVEGKVFGSDKMSDWTVMAEGRRFTFSNPQPGLYDRIAAVRQIVRQVPVEGRILFLEGAEFTKGVPSLVCTLEELVAEFGEPDMDAAMSKVEAFQPHWELVRKTAG
jgi:hypothetical protein